MDFVSEDAAVLFSLRPLPAGRPYDLSLNVVVVFSNHEAFYKPVEGFSPDPVSLNPVHRRVHIMPIAQCLHLGEHGDRWGWFPLTLLPFQTRSWHRPFVGMRLINTLERNRQRLGWMD